MSTNVLILAAGQITFDTHDGGYPLCLTEMEGLSLLERIVANTNNISEACYTFCLQNKEVERFHLDKVVNLLVPGAKVVRAPESTQGSACTALLAASQFVLTDELLIISANEYVDIDFAMVLEQFRQRKLDAGTIVFRSVHPRYSYVRLNPEGLVVEAAQQSPISHHATVGVFWFSRVQEFIEAAKNTIRKNACVDGKFFVAPTFNELILKQSRIGIYEIENNRYHPLKTERHVQQFENDVSA